MLGLDGHNDNNNIVTLFGGWVIQKEIYEYGSYRTMQDNLIWIYIFEHIFAIINIFHYSDISANSILYPFPWLGFLSLRDSLAFLNMFFLHTNHKHKEASEEVEAVNNSKEDLMVAGVVTAGNVPVVAVEEVMETGEGPEDA